MGKGSRIGLRRPRGSRLGRKSVEGIPGRASNSHGPSDANKSGWEELS